MISHDVGLIAARTIRIVWAVTRLSALFGGGDKAVHLAVVDVGYGIWMTMGGAVIDVVRIVIRPHATSRVGIGNADNRNAVTYLDAVGTGEGAEITIE